MDEYKPSSTPIVIGVKLSKEKTTGEFYQTQYRSMIEKL